MPTERYVRRKRLIDVKEHTSIIDREMAKYL
jgi:hypothetical protein